MKPDKKEHIQNVSTKDVSVCLDEDSSMNTLPKDFFEKVIDLENSLILEIDIQAVETLALMYQKAIQYYSSRNRQRALDFLYRLKVLFSNQDVIKKLNKARLSQSLTSSTPLPYNTKSILSEFNSSFETSVEVIKEDMQMQKKNMQKTRSNQRRISLISRESVIRLI